MLNVEHRQSSSGSCHSACYAAVSCPLVICCIVSGEAMHLLIQLIHCNVDPVPFEPVLTLFVSDHRPARNTLPDYGNKSTPSSPTVQQNWHACVPSGAVGTGLHTAVVLVPHAVQSTEPRACSTVKAAFKPFIAYGYRQSTKPARDFVWWARPTSRPQTRKQPP